MNTRDPKFDPLTRAEMDALLSDPLNPEPRLLAVVIDDDGDAWQRSADHGGQWVMAGDDVPLSWAELDVGYGPLELVWSVGGGGVDV